MSGPAENRNKDKFCEFHRDKGHIIDEWAHAKTAKKGETLGKEKAMAIFMVQPWQRVTRQKSLKASPQTERSHSHHSQAVTNKKAPWIVAECPAGHLPNTSTVDVFAWKPVDMTGVPRYITEHCLNIRERCPPVRQKKNGQAPGRNKAIQEERLVDKVFEKQIGRNLEVYVDDLVIKSQTKQQILRDIEETFQTLRKINMKLNPKKCTFSAEEGMFLGHVINMKGIKACPEKAKAVIKLQSLRTLKDVQSLNGKLVSLDRGGKGIPRYEAMHRGAVNANRAKTKRRTNNVSLRSHRSGQCSPTNRKRFTADANLLHQLRPASSESKLQLNGKTSVSSSVHLKKVKKIFPSTSNTFDINYRPRTAIRGQVLADFIAKRPDEDGAQTKVHVKEIIPDPWTLSMDGFSCLEGSGAGLILINPERIEFTYALRFEFNASNNEAEYEALIAGLHIAK
ncbi:reverse transcriptase domain-containing protein [Tanacetum coccineum]